MRMIATFFHGQQGEKEYYIYKKKLVFILLIEKCFQRLF